MPLIRIEYDENKISNDQARQLAEATQKVVSEVTGIGDVFVYANSSKIRVKIAPVEVFVEISAHKIEDKKKLTADIKEKLSSWRKDSNFSAPINLTIIPMDWVVEIDI